MKRTQRKLDDVWRKAPVVLFHDNTKIVIMSDCHRGIANWGDNFAPNENLFFAALNYYYKNGYAYIELGDGDELWENRDMQQVMRAHSEAFHMMSEFYKKNRFLMILGNHDRVKEKNIFAGKYLEEYFPGIKILEGIRLKNQCSGNELFLVHGHQGDLLNDTMWMFGRFLVRYVWRPLELFGVNDPTDAGKSREKANRVERKLQTWARERQITLIAGHTHRPRLSDRLPAYLNTGSCVHPRCITAIELSDGELTLVKWAIYVREDNSLKIEKEILDGPVKLV